MFEFERKSMHTGSEQAHADDGGKALFYTPGVASAKMQRGLWYAPAQLPTEKYTGDYSPASVRRYYGGTGAETENGLWTLFDAANTDVANTNAAGIGGMPKQPRFVRTLLDVAMEQEAMRTCTQQAKTENGK